MTMPNVLQIIRFTAQNVARPQGGSSKNDWTDEVRLLNDSPGTLKEHLSICQTDLHQFVSFLLDQILSRNSQEYLSVDDAEKYGRVQTALNTWSHIHTQSDSTHGTNVEFGNRIPGKYVLLEGIFAILRGNVSFRWIFLSFSTNSDFFWHNFWPYSREILHFF